MDTSIFVDIFAGTTVIAACGAWFFVAQMAIGKRVRGPFPLSMVVILVVTTAITLAQFIDRDVLTRLERHAGDLSSGRYWKLITPLFVQSDGWGDAISNTIAFLIVAFVAERVYGRRRVLLMYFIPGIVGDAFGFAWTDHGAANSVAIAGLIGGFFMLQLAYQHRLPKIAPILAIVGLVGALVLSFLSEIHGPAILTGAALGYVLNHVSPMLPHHAPPQVPNAA